MSKKTGEGLEMAKMVRKAGKAGGEKIRVAVGLSGGVDSAVSAYLLKKRGYDVSCVYLNCYDGDTPGCRGDNDRKDALAVAMHLNLPFQVLDFRKEYQAAVIDYFKKEYLLGRTPNPDVVCNRDIKFGLFLDWSIKEGFDYVATGHYADGPDLKIPTDLHKDQTYFLWAVPGEKFKRVLFPLGNLLKTEVREIARKAGLLVADKKDSTGICFVGEVRVEDFLKQLGVKEKEGEVVVRNERQTANVERRTLNVDQFPTHNVQFSTPNAQRTTYAVVGSHRGVWFYTIGQRHGFSTDLRSSKNNTEYRMTNTEWKERQIRHSEFSIQNSVFSDRPPLYVIEKDIKKNRLIVGFGAECYRSQFQVSDLNWLVKDNKLWIVDSKRQKSGAEKTNSMIYDLRSTIYDPVFVRIRHGGELIPCTVMNVERRTLNVDQRPTYNVQHATPNAQRTTYTVRLREPQRGIAPGQSAVFYSKDGIALGGGVIQ